MSLNILHQEDDVILESVFDINKNFAKVVSNKTGAKVCNQDAELFKNKDIDAILIASVTSTHADYIEKALTNHKPVFCEIPIDLSLNRIRQCYNRIKKNDLPIQIGFNRRFDPSHAKIKNLLKENKIGQLNQVIITSRDPEMPSEEYYKSAGGLFRDMTIHDFDLARFYLDEDPIEIFASAQKLIDPNILYGSWAGAYGNFQFMPSTIERYAIDYNNDKKIELKKSLDDALASAANYINKIGWKFGEPCFYRVKIQKKIKESLS